MKKSVLVLSVIGIITLLSTVVQATVVEYKLDEPPQYEREIGPVQISPHSVFDIYVENIECSIRWKEWQIVIWVPVGEDDLTAIDVDYSNDTSHTAGQELEWLYDVPLDPYTGPLSVGEDWKGFYADTWLSQWEEFGTNPVGSGLPHPWGNPKWVSFHFNVEADPFIYIKDACLIPEPATVCLLGLGALGLLRKRRA